jgi:hypothetical protein
MVCCFVIAYNGWEDRIEKHDVRSVYFLSSEEEWIHHPRKAEAKR